MASTFRISEHRSSASLHLRLSGDFDEGSALELVEFLQSRCGGSARVFVHTNDLEAIRIDGHDSFQKIFEASYGKRLNLIFTGENANRFVPARTSRAEVISGKRKGRFSLANPGSTQPRDQ